MSTVMELIAGALVALATLYLVLEPLFRTAPVGHAVDESELFHDVEEDESPKVRALLALKEIEFDRATGKLSDEDYLLLKRQYSNRVLEALDGEAGVARGKQAGADRVEEIILEARQHRAAQPSCPVCGPRPEAGAMFCSKCGSKLSAAGDSGSCPSCGSILEPGAKFCGSCGTRTAA